MKPIKEVHELLDMTSEVYENNIRTMFFEWAKPRATCLLSFQAIIANSAINKWFLAEIKKREQDFRSRIRFTSGDVAVDYRKCYVRCMETIYEIYPSALVASVQVPPHKQPYIRTKLIDMPVFTTLNCN